MNAQGQLIKIPPARVGLSTTSVYPESTSSAFELARRLGYDGVEIMVGIDPVAADIDAVEKLRDYHEVPVLAIHSPCLLITQRVWGTDPWAKLERSAEAALRLDADVVVVHPPFRWQRDYARGFVEGVRRLAEATGILFCVENMYPWRTPGGELKAYVPGWDPTRSRLRRPHAGSFARLDCRPAIHRSCSVLGVASAARPSHRWNRLSQGRASRARPR